MPTFMVHVVRCRETAIEDKRLLRGVLEPVPGLDFLLIRGAICVEKKLSVQMKLALGGYRLVFILRMGRTSAMTLLAFLFWRSLPPFAHPSIIRLILTLSNYVDSLCGFRHGLVELLIKIAPVLRLPVFFFFFVDDDTCGFRVFNL